MRTVRVVADPQELARAAAEELTRIACDAMEARSLFRVVLAGGSTPRRLYELLADGSARFLRTIPWDKVRFVMGDERRVPPNHPDSNYRMACESLLSKLPVRPVDVIRFRSEGEDVDLVATSYESQLREAFKLGPHEIPRLDLVLLGMGQDGHIASIFPGSEVLHENEKLAAAPWVEKLNAHRFTLTPVVLNHAAQVVFLVSGAEKAETLRKVLEGDTDPDRLPAQVVRPTNGEVLWLADRDAARLLS